MQQLALATRQSPGVPLTDTQFGPPVHLHRKRGTPCVWDAFFGPPIRANTHIDSDPALMDVHGPIDDIELRLLPSSQTNADQKLLSQRDEERHTELDQAASDRIRLLLHQDPEL